MTNEKITKTPYIIRLTINPKNSETYRVSKDLFITIKNIIKPYQSFKNKPKKVKCIETGEIFENAKDANDMLIQKGISYSYDAYNRIKKYAIKNVKQLMDCTGSLLISKIKIIWIFQFMLKSIYGYKS